MPIKHVGPKSTKEEWNEHVAVTSKEGLLCRSMDTRPLLSCRMQARFCAEPLQNDLPPGNKTLKVKKN